MRIHINQINFDSNEVTYQLNNNAGLRVVGPVTIKFAEDATVAQIRQEAIASARILGAAERTRLAASVSDLAAVETEPMS